MIFSLRKADAPPTKVLTIDIECIGDIADDSLKGYTRAFILIRVHGRPVGQVFCAIRDGRLTASDLKEAILPIAQWSLIENRVHDFLGWQDEFVRHPSTDQATVAVCTRDRPEDLCRCLTALRSMPDDGQEILVIDNCPRTDQSERVVSHFPGVRYVIERTPGVSAARNRALREATHGIVAFSDDDAAPSRGWLRALLRAFKEPSVMCVTGLTLPLELETSAQNWFERHTPFGRGYKRFVTEVTDGNPLNVARVGTSANMALRKSVMDYVGLFDEALGPGTRCKTGEDFDMFSRILTSGYGIIYDPDAVSWHRHRREWDELRRTVYGYGLGVYAYMTKQAICHREFGVASIAYGWARHIQLPALLRSLRGDPSGKPLDILLAELCGCLIGPWAYLLSRIQQATKR